QIHIKEVENPMADSVSVLVGDSLEVRARVHLGELDPKFVRVQAYFGEANDSQISKATITDLNDCEKIGIGDYLYRGTIPASESGAYGFSVRVIPSHPILAQAHELRLITWAR